MGKLIWSALLLGAALWCIAMGFSAIR